MFKFLIKKKHLKQHDNQEFKISNFFRSVDLNFLYFIYI